MQRFELGRLVATPGALKVLDDQGLGPLVLLARHAFGDWGELCDEDKRANEEALVNGERLLSRYTVGDQPVWIITEHDRSATTVLLPDEY